MTAGCNNAAAWAEGAAAARARKPPTANPYPREDYRFVTWLNGWAQAAHAKAKEEEL